MMTLLVTCFLPPPPWLSDGIGTNRLQLLSFRSTHPSEERCFIERKWPAGALRKVLSQTRNPYAMGRGPAIYYVSKMRQFMCEHTARMTFGIVVCRVGDDS